VAVTALVVLGGFLTVLAILSVWVERQALDTNEWTKTSEELLADEDIEIAVSNFLVEELQANVDVKAGLEQRLPAQAQPLAAPISALVIQLADQAARRALSGPRLQAAWVEANRTAHEKLLDVIDGEVGAVDLELQPLVSDLATRVGLDPSVADRLPPDVGTIQIVDEDQISTVQEVAKAIKGLAIVLSILALGSLALAIYLAEGRRSAAILWSGLALVGAAIAVLAIRKAAGGLVVEELVVNESATAAGESTWEIGTSLLKSVAWTVLIFGILFSVAAWLGSEARGAKPVRKAIAPTLKDHPGLVYALVGFAALIYLALAPTHGLRAFLTVCLLAGLAFVGVSALRKQVSEEFPRA
jgi:hypothetical protein